jgi:hypothetical protein
MDAVAYVSREQVKRLLDVKATALIDDQIDDAAYSASEAIHGKTLRWFHPWIGTQSWDWPNWQYADSWRLWLNDREAVSLTEVTSGGTTLDPAGYFLTNPGNVSGPPYAALELDQSASAGGTFNSGASWQRAVTGTGTFYWPFTARPAGQLETGAGMDVSQTSATVTNGSVFTGVRTLDLIRIDTELMIVTGRTAANTGQTVLNGAGLTAAVNDQAITVASGPELAAGEQITIDAETMLITTVVGNTLVVKRAWDGSTLAAHSLAAPIYADRALTLQRAALGSTAATHAAGTAISRHAAPALVSSLARALTVNELLQQTSGYAMTVGSGDNEREASGKAIGQLWDKVCSVYGRTPRMAAV